MSWQVIMRAGPEDVYSPANSEAGQTLTVPLSIPGHADTIGSTVADEFAHYCLTPPTSAWDLLYASIAAYTADVRIPRKSGYDGWTRDITLHLAVEAPEHWDLAGPIFERLLTFLTGDRWEVQIHPAPQNYNRPTGQAKKQIPLSGHTVSLFSGGLDSFIGAIDLLEADDEQVVLVGHHGLGGGPTSTSQSRAYNKLIDEYPAERLPFLRLWVSPPKGQYRASEITTRGRSVLFLGLGVAVAAGRGGATLVVPENGFISLNVPLTPSRTGSFSTRTTHPYLISLLRDLLQALHLPVEILLPYRFQTKGEMVRRVANSGVLATGLTATMSCARPGVGRFSEERDPNLHCGYCLPCLIRRAALSSAGADPTRYLFGDLRQPLSDTRQADIRALNMALAQYATNPPTIADILLSGPLPGSDGETASYLEMFMRGIEELRVFMGDHYKAG